MCTFPYLPSSHTAAVPAGGCTVPLVGLIAHGAGLPLELEERIEVETADAGLTVRLTALHRG